MQHEKRLRRKHRTQRAAPKMLTRAGIAALRGIRRLQHPRYYSALMEPRRSRWRLTAPPLPTQPALSVGCWLPAPTSMQPWTTEPRCSCAAASADKQAALSVLLVGATMTTNGTTALMVAAEHCDAAAVSALVLAGADADAATNVGTTALMAASRCAQRLSVLLRAGADPNRTATDGTTALLLAVRLTYPQSLNMLLGFAVETDETGL